jgi:F-actin-capping protein subunit alpha
VKLLVGDSTVLSDAKVNSIMHDYNLYNFVGAEAPDNSGRKVLVTPFGEVSEDSFLDPQTGRVLTFDHVAQRFTGETDQKQVLSDSMESTRTSVEKAVTEYLDAAYKSGKASCAVYGTDDGKINVCVSAVNAKLRAYWTGNWVSKYTVDVSNPGKSDISCDVRVNVHYFEDGNVQLRTDMKDEISVQVGSAEETAKSIVSAIDKFESKFQTELEEIYVNMHATTFKGMRRFLPVTGQPMNWNPAAHNVATEMGRQ